MIRGAKGVYKSSVFQMMGNGFSIPNYFPNGNKFGRKIRLSIMIKPEDINHAPKGFTNGKIGVMAKD